MKKFVVSMFMAFSLAVGCVRGNAPTATNAITQVPAQQASADKAPMVAPTTTPSAAGDSAESGLVSPTPPVLVAQDPMTQIVDMKVGDDRVEEAVRFTVQSTGSSQVSYTVTNPEAMKLYRYDRLGQPELVEGAVQPGSSSTVLVTIPAVPEGSASFLLAGREKPIPFENVPYGVGTQEVQQYGTQEPPCASNADSIRLTLGNPDPNYGYPVNIYAWTYDTSFPVKAMVYAHPGLGWKGRPTEYSFGRWIEYNRTRSPDKDRLAADILDYTVDEWNTRLAPDVGADAYNARRRGCDDPGRQWIDVCHSAGCLEAWIAHLKSWPSGFWNYLGLEALMPAFGGSDLALKESNDYVIATQHMPRRMSVIAHLLRQDAGFLAENPPGRTLGDVLQGSGLAFQNEGVRSVTWDGTGPGIPTVVYSWFSAWDTTAPFLKRRITPNARYTMPTSNLLGGYAPGTYTDPSTNAQRFNYVEAVNAYTAQMLKVSSFPGAGKIDIIAGYMTGDIAGDSARFLKRFEKDAILETAWKGTLALLGFNLDPIFLREYQSWQNILIAKSPQVDHPNDLDKNEKGPNDGFLTILQQAWARAGRTILAPGSKFGAFKIDMGALQDRLPPQVATISVVPGLTHADIATDSPTPWWDTMNRRILKRLEGIHAEEREFILTDEEKQKIFNIFFRADGGTFYDRWDSSISRYTLKRVFDPPSTYGVTFRQDPLGVGAKNRVRLGGKAYLPVTYYYWDSYIDEWMVVSLSNPPLEVPMNYDFILRSGVWHLVRER